MPAPSAFDQALDAAGLRQGIVLLTASRALIPSDAGKCLVYTDAADIVLTLPTAGLRAAFNATVFQLGAGRITLSGAGTIYTSRSTRTSQAGDSIILRGVSAPDAAIAWSLGGGSVSRMVGYYTWAQLQDITGMADGDEAIVTNLPAAGMRSRWYYDLASLAWRPFGPTSVALDTTLRVGVAQAGDQYIGPGLSLAIALLKGARFIYRYALGKTGTTDAFGAATNVRLGIAATIADAAIATQNYSAAGLQAANRSLGTENHFLMASSVLIERIGTNSNANAGASFVSAIGGTLALGLQVATPDVSAVALSIGVSTTMGGTTDSPQLGYQEVVRLA